MMKTRRLATFATVFSSLAGSSWALEVPVEILKGLATEDFRSREAAEADLLQWGRKRREPAMKELLLQSRIAEDPEVRRRCGDVLWLLVIDGYLMDGQGYLGIWMEERAVNIPGIGNPRFGIEIVLVFPATPAAAVGLKRDDVIVGLGDVMWSEPGARESFAKEIQRMKPSTKVTIKILREEKLLEVAVVLGRKPPEQQGQELNPEAADRAAKEAYFRDWLAKRKLEE